jgi:hypothetical protein
MDARTLTPANSLAKKAKNPFPGESEVYHSPRPAVVRALDALGLKRCQRVTYSFYLR